MIFTREDPMPVTHQNEDRCFDREKAERDLHEVMFSMGIGAWTGYSNVPGIAVYVCDDLVDTDEIRRALEDRGHSVTQVLECTWVTEEGHDEDVVAVAFDVPELPDDWRIQPSRGPDTP